MTIDLWNLMKEHARTQMALAFLNRLPNHNRPPISVVEELERELATLDKQICEAIYSEKI